MLPFSTLAISIKFESSVELKVFLASAKVIFNLWAPGAFTFEEPWALSFNELSSPGVVNASVTDKPIL